MEFSEILTERLRLRRLEMDDDRAVFDLRSNEIVNKFTGIIPPKEIGEAQAFIEKINNGVAKNQWAYWAICRKTDGVFMGTISLWNYDIPKNTAELGYALLPDADACWAGFHRSFDRITTLATDDAL